MRWLTVTVPGEPEREILLERQGPPSMDDATAEQLRELVMKGAAGWTGFETVDCRRTYEELVARGVEFSQEPTEQSYGIGCCAGRPVRQPHPVLQRAANRRRRRPLRREPPARGVRPCSPRIGAAPPRSAGGSARRR
jgi:hypothetical protein